MARMKPLRPFEILAIFLALPSLVLGAIVLAMEIWPPPGPGENGMAIVIPCGIGSIVFFVLFMIVAAAARLRWRVFVSIVSVWVAFCAALFVMESRESERLSDPRPRHISIRRTDTLDSSLMQSVFLVRDEAQCDLLVASGRFGTDPEHTLIVGESALACLSERIGRLTEAPNPGDERVLEIEVVHSGMEMRASVARSRVPALLDSVGECVGAPARERIAELRAGIETGPLATDEKK